MGMAPSNPFNYEDPSDTLKRWEDDEKGKYGRASGKRFSPRWEIKLPPDEDGSTSGQFALRQAIQQMNFQRLMRDGVGNVDIEGERQARAGVDRALATAAKRQFVVENEKKRKDALIKLQRDLFLAGGKPDDDQQKKLWALQDEYEKAAKEKAFFLQQHPEGDYIGWF